MSREIKFRGKDIDRNKWRYGSLVKVRENDGTLLYYIIDEENQQWIVFPETVGQYTGLKDKNGKEIYESDIFRIKFPDCMAVVTWDTECARFIGCTLENERKIVYVDRVDKHNISAIEVIGNIYENPELLEV